METLSSTATQKSTTSRRNVWPSRVVQGIVVIFLLLDGAVHLAVPTPVVEAMNRLGIPPSLAVTLGIVELVCTALYVIPATSILGAILLTGYLGGAVAIHMRAGSPVFEAYVFPALVGALVWGGLYLRDERLRTLVPLRRPRS